MTITISPIVAFIIALIFVLIVSEVFTRYEGLKESINKLKKDNDSKNTQSNGMGKQRLKDFIDCIPHSTSLSPVYNWRMYHVLIDRFNGNWTTPPSIDNERPNMFIGGTIKGVTCKLDYIQGLGMNAIMLSPMYRSLAYHGYHIVDYEAISDSFGTWEDFEELVNEAHIRQMKVICDFVPNHCHIDHPLFQEALNGDKERRKWFYFKNGTEYECFMDIRELPKINLTYLPAADYFINIAEKLVDIGIDGIRIDHAMGVPFDFLRRFRKVLKRRNPDLFVFGEVWMPDVKFVNQLQFVNYQRKEQFVNHQVSQDQIQRDYAEVLDGVLDFAFLDIIVDEITTGHRLKCNSDLANRLKRHFNGYSPWFAPILFLDNHDTNRFMHYCNRDKNMLIEAMEFVRNQPYPFSMYYGTEQYMTNDSSIVNADPYADLSVRLPMDWSKTL